MIIYTWNINGIRAAEKKGYFDWLQRSGADIVALQETKAGVEQLTKRFLMPEGYIGHFAQADKKGYSGVVVYNKIIIPGWEHCETRIGFGDESVDRGEGRVVIEEYKRSCIDGRSNNMTAGKISYLVLINGYFPNGGRGPELVQYKLNFYRKCIEVAKEYLSQGKEVIITGDFNTAFAGIDLARPAQNNKTSGFLPEEREGLGWFFDAGFVDVFRLLYPEKVQYTWWDQKTRARERNIGWRIDYFMLSPGLIGEVKGCDILEDVMGSDHCPIRLELDL